MLEEIGRCRSLAAAARALDMSYTRAWQWLVVLNAMFEQPVALTHPGRNVDGSTELTPFGERVITQYCAIESHATQAASAWLSQLAGAARGESASATRGHRLPGRAAKRAAQPSRGQMPRRPDTYPGNECEPLS